MSDFHLLIQEQLPKLMRYATALTRDPDDASELVEDAVMEALAHQRDFRGDGNIRIRLLTMLHDLRNNPFRRSLDAQSLSMREPEALLTLSQLDHALGQLPEEQRAIILLVGLEGLTYGETAAVLRIPVGTMRSRLSRARAVLRAAMGIAARPRLARAA
jgi:RNA polymerase sigma-70 factor (ECF subfamily)